MLLKLFHKGKTERTFLNSLYKINLTLILKSDKKNSTKIKLLANISDEHRNNLRE